MTRRRVKTRYQEPQPGEWVRPVRRGYRLACCDCGLVHAIDFRVLKGPRGQAAIEVRYFRDNRSTAAIRREKRKREKA